MMILCTYIYFAKYLMIINHNLRTHQFPIRHNIICGIHFRIGHGHIKRLRQLFRFLRFSRCSMIVKVILLKSYVVVPIYCLCESSPLINRLDPDIRCPKQVHIAYNSTISYIQCYTYSRVVITQNQSLKRAPESLWAYRN